MVAAQRGKACRATGAIGESSVKDRRGRARRQGKAAMNAVLLRSVSAMPAYKTPPAISGESPVWASAASNDEPLRRESALFQWPPRFQASYRALFSSFGG
jgi:hypothetical protein